jgi:signal transduction histidine kinase
VILSDDGTGFTEQAKPKGVGITHMQHRTKLLGGTISWDLIQPHGTCLRIAIPIN